jgi:hypothetical protein
MSTESQALRILRAFKKDVVQEWLLLWTSFRCILDRVLCRDEWRAKYPVPLTLLSVPGSLPPHVDQDALLKELDACMARTAPKRFSGKEYPAKRARIDTGVPLWASWHKMMVQNPFFYLAKTGDKRGAGLFARRNLTFKDVYFALYGWLCVIGSEEYEKLHDNLHPSLYEFREKRYILGGPLSCVNHACNAPVGFSPPCTLPREGFETPPFTAHLLTLRNLTDNASSARVFSKGDEILVCYQDDYPDCLCNACKE